MKKILTSLWKFLRNKKEGFTLIEIVAVLAIIGFLAAGLVPSIEMAMDRSKNTKMITDLATVDSAIKLYDLENGALPETLESLRPDYLSASKTYKDAKNNAFTYTKTDSGSYTLTGVNTKGKEVLPDGSVVKGV